MIFFPACKKSLRTISLRFYNSFIPGELYKRVGLKPVGSGFYEKTMKGLLEDNLPDIPLQWPRASRYLTRSKQRIVNEIGYEVQSLVENAFLDKSGNSSQLIYGEKGIGKSSALTLSVMGVWLHYGNVIPIYVEYTGRVEEYKSPADLICQHLHISETTPLSQCLKLLSDRGEYVLFIADEVEQLYSGVDFKPLRRKVLDELAELGSQRTGRCYTILCGSSSLVPMLISKNAVHDDALRKEFPMVEFAPNLNSRKFAPFRLHRGLDLQFDFNVLKSHYKISDALCNQLYFIAGSNLRTIDTIIQKLRSRNMDEESIRSGSGILEYCYPPSMWDLRVQNTFSANEDLIRTLSVASVRKNRALISRVYRDIDQISSISWVAEVKPLTRYEVRTICEKFNCPVYLLSLLVDKGYFSAPPSLDHLNLAKPMDLLFYYPQYLSERPWNRFLKWVSSTLSGTIKDTADHTSREILTRVIQASVRLFNSSGN